MLELWQKIVISVVLIGVMVGGGFYLYSKGQSAFDNEVVIRYPSGCTEVYINNNLTTEKCPDSNSTTGKFTGGIISQNITLDINITDNDIINVTDINNTINMTNSS